MIKKTYYTRDYERWITPIERSGDTFCLAFGKSELESKENANIIETADSNRSMLSLINDIQLAIFDCSLGLTPYGKEDLFEMLKSRGLNDRINEFCRSKKKEQ